MVGHENMAENNLLVQIVWENCGLLPVAPIWIATGSFAFSKNAFGKSDEIPHGNENNRFMHSQIPG